MRKLNKYNITCIILLWCYLCYLLIDRSGFNTQTAITLVTSGVIVFVPIYKYLRKGR